MQKINTQIIPRSISGSAAKQQSSVPSIAGNFQSLLSAKCKPTSQLVPATLMIDLQDLPIKTNMQANNNFYCTSDWRSAPNISVSFYDSDQGYLLFDQDWFYDTLLLKGDPNSEYKPNAKGILIRKMDNIDQYIMLEGRNARFTSDANTWLELYSVKKDPNSSLKIMTHTTLISGANKDFAGVLMRGSIETYTNTAEEYATLMNKIITELLNPIKDPEKAIIDAQAEKLSKIEFK